MTKGLRFSGLREEFQRYLLEVRGMSERSIKKHLQAFGWFGRFLAEKRVRLARNVSLDFAYEFLEQKSQGCSQRHVKALHGGVRHVLRFLYYIGELRRNIAESMMVPGTWRLAHIPRSFSNDEVNIMIAGLRPETSYDHRECLVILLFICYGLRLKEVADLCLDDIDWGKKTVTVRERKNDMPLVLPLLPQVETALRGYLAHFRPSGLKTRRLFVTIKRRSRAPLGEQAIHEIVKKFLKRCGLEGCATKFRHTLATHLINKGVGLESIGAVLGHRCSDSTRIYAKVHWEALREVAQNYSLNV